MSWTINALSCLVFLDSLWSILICPLMVPSSSFSGGAGLGSFLLPYICLLAWSGLDVVTFGGFSICANGLGACWFKTSFLALRRKEPVCWTNQEAFGKSWIKLFGCSFSDLFLRWSCELHVYSKRSCSCWIVENAIISRVDVLVTCCPPFFHASWGNTSSPCRINNKDLFCCCIVHFYFSLPFSLNAGLAYSVLLISPLR